TLIDRRPSAPSTSRLAAFASASYVLAIAVATVVDPAALDVSLAIVLIYAASSLPYVLVSWIVVRALGAAPASAGRTYAADLGVAPPSRPRAGTCRAGSMSFATARMGRRARTTSSSIRRSPERGRAH